MINQLPSSYKHQQAFSLIEMAIVLVILGFILTAVLVPYQAQRQQLQMAETKNTLENARAALLGYAQTNGRLPCPATAVNNTDIGSLGQENPSGGTRNITPPAAVPACAVKVGYLPAATLGIQPVDANGFAIDAWNNRIRYAVTESEDSARVVNGSSCGGDTAPDFTTSGNLGVVGLVCVFPDLRVCSTSTGITATACSGGTETNYLINNAVAVIYSTGSTGAQAAGGADENANLNNDSVFVSHDVNAAGATGGEFDHIVTWISPFVLYNAMIQAGQLH